MADSVKQKAPAAGNAAPAKGGGKQGKGKSYYVHTVIGFAILAVFWLMPPVEPITEVGMRVVGVFIMMVYLWSTIGTLWPSLVGLFFLGISGAGGDAGFNGVFMNSVGNYQVLMCIFAFILFGGLDACGATLYIAKWFLTKKIFKGRPYVFLACFAACAFAMAALIGAAPALIILWPIAKRVMDLLGVQRGDKVWPFFFIGLYLGITLGQPFFPFKGAALAPVSSFAAMTANMGEAHSIPYLSYMLISAIMAALIILAYTIYMRVLRVDTGKLRDVDPALIDEQLPLPKMNTVQKCYMWMLPIFILSLLLPSFISGNPVSDFLNSIGILGVPAAITAIFLIVRVDGKPLLDFKEVAYHKFDWGIFFMLAAALYSATLLSNSKLGISTWLVNALTPILGGQSEMAFVAIMFTAALIITSFANNAAMGVVLMPVAITFSNQMGIDPTPVAMGVCYVVFIAMLTPAASPYCAMMWGNKELYSPKEILSVGFPMCVIMLLMYIFIGYPLAKFFIGIGL